MPSDKQLVKMTSTRDYFPEFYVSYPPEDSDELGPVYYTVTGYDPDGHVFWRNKGHTRSKETAFYDMFLEEKNGFGIERCDKEDTPWAKG